MAASYRLTAGNKAALFVLYLAALVSPLAVCACGIGLVFWMPYMAVASVVAYLLLTGHWSEETSDSRFTMVAVSADRSQRRDARAHAGQLKLPAELVWGAAALAVIVALAGLIGGGWYALKATKGQAAQREANEALLLSVKAAIGQKLSVPESEIVLSRVKFSEPFSGTRVVTGQFSVGGQQPQSFSCQFFKNTMFLEWP